MNPASGIDAEDQNLDNDDVDSVDNEVALPQGIAILVSAITLTPVIFFEYPAYLGMSREIPQGFEVKPWDGRLTYHGTKRYLYNAVKNVLKRASGAKTSKPSWNLFWGSVASFKEPDAHWSYRRHLESAQYAALVSGQKTNHFPASLELGRKDRLCSNILRMQRKFGSFFEIIPETYVTGGKECKPFMTALAAHPNALWILKPPNQCCGRGIKIIQGGSDYKYEPDKRYVAQRYIYNPYLINGFKFDMRLYVLVTSFDPLRVYLFDNGLKYSKKDVQNRFGHLTNYSINKKNKAFQSNQDAAEDGTGSKWSYKAINHSYQSSYPDKIHVDIAQVIVKTLMSVEVPIVDSLNAFKHAHEACFELYGFDILLDSSLRPWLLEVNVFPSMSSSSPMDKRIKSILVCDTFQLVGFPAVKVAESQDAQLKARRNRSGSKKLTKDGSTEESKVAKEMRWKRAIEDEAARQGHFQRIFPTTETTSYLSHFEKPRESNAFYADLLRATHNNSTTEIARRPSFTEKLNRAKQASFNYG
ncbi:hypothetical protein LEN26_008209 [Aphanomyces euteiches]|nr:hypothetical protein LEN26_008209 [Aphanomyces euteiches]